LGRSHAVRAPAGPAWAGLALQKRQMA